MQPRFITRTHYQVDEPAYLLALVRVCTSPVRSDYRERVASRLTDHVRSWGRDFNRAAAAYAIDLARGLGLLNDKLAWTERAHLVNLVADELIGPDRETFSLEDRIVIFRTFMDGDGAALLFLARSVLDAHELSGKGRTWNDVANEMELSIYRDYLELAEDPTDRTRIRGAFDRRKAQPFSGKSGAHQTFVHLQALYRMGLVDREASGQTRRYSIRDGLDPEPLSVLVRAVPGVRELEDTVKRDSCLKLAERVFSWELPAPGGDESLPADEDLVRDLLPYYTKAMATGVPVCPLRPLIESVLITRMTAGLVVPTYPQALESVQRFQRAHAREIRLHVDYLGLPAYLKIDDGFSL